MLKVLDLFSGIGGFSLGLERTGGFKTVAFCEIEPFCRQVLKKHWPDVPIFDDVRTLKGSDVGDIDVICGGYPCQPFSLAGKRLGAADDRHLWPEMLRLIRECNPSWVIAENVVGHVNMGLDSVLSNLEEEGYATRTFVIPACGVNAPHKRERLWIIGNKEHSAEQTDDGWICRKCNQDVFGGCEHYHGEWQCADCGEWTYPFHYTFSEGCQVCGSKNVAYPERQRGCSGIGARKDATYANDAGEISRKSGKGWEVEPSMGRLAYGLSGGLARHQLRSLGNAVVPQIPEIIGWAILKTYMENHNG